MGNHGKDGADRYHAEIGRVVEVRGGRAIVEIELPAGVGSKPECAHCGLCSAAGSGAGAKPELLASVPADLRLAPGDRVELRLRLANPGKAGVILLGLPLAAFIGAMLLANWIWKSEPAMMACGFGALAGAFLVLHLVSRRRGARAEIVGKA